MHKEISIFCSEIGKNKLLVQGAGGNVSWKCNDVLSIKASGTWLSDALHQDIFVSVDLKEIRLALSEGYFDTQLKVLDQTLKKPSIETMLHGLMPHSIVVHLHMVEILAHTLEKFFNFSEFLSNFSFSYKVIDYVQPGPSLSKVIFLSLENQEYPDILFLKNHGVVIGGSDINDIKSKITALEKQFKTNIPDLSKKIPHHSEVSEYRLIDDIDIQQIVFNESLYSRLNSNWALYPDHIVFLGPQAYFYDSWHSFKKGHNNPELIFIKNNGVYTEKDFSKAKVMQLRCYLDVISRLNDNILLDTLNREEIFNLLNWDSEKYRVSTSK
jgi:rhamnose utilization protein RhaD (predicted bifunctional aldolase and dehydrogenase)